MAHTALVTNGMAAAPPHNSLGTNAGLVFIHGPAGYPASFPLRAPRVTVGRGPGVHVPLDDVEGVSRLHAGIEYRDGVWVLEDLGSMHGTFVNGVRVREAPLEASAIVRLGKCLFKFVAVGVEGYARYDLDGLRIAPDDEATDGTPATCAPELRRGGHRMVRVHRVLQRLATSHGGVVLAGEGDKERCARLLHTWRRRSGGFWRIDCAGATAPHIATALAECDIAAGTLLFDAADDLSADDVAHLRRVLDGRAVEVPEAGGRGGPYRARMAGASLDPVDVDVVVGLRDAERPAVALALPGPAYLLTIPPLRDRKEALRAHVLQILDDLERPDIMPGFGFMIGLAHHDFPGDVQELREIVEHGLAADPRAYLELAHLPERLRARVRALYPS